jgi:hypothetical protein
MYPRHQLAGPSLGWGWGASGAASLAAELKGRQNDDFQLQFIFCTQKILN